MAISIPIFTAQLEKARDATTLSNIRAAYAEAQAAYLTEVDSPDGRVHVTKDGGKVTKVEVSGVTAKGTQTNSGFGSELPFAPSNITAMDNTPKDYKLSFNYDAQGKLTVTAA